MIQARAYRVTAIALRNGVLIRPDACERCGIKPGKGKDGRSLIQGHHHDYAKPLDVEWICAKCHRKETPLPERPGAPVHDTRNGQAKLNEAQVLEIRAKRNISSRKLAKLYGVEKSTILRVWRGENWGQV